MTVLRASSMNNPSHILSSYAVSSPKRMYQERMRRVHRKEKKVVSGSIDAIHASSSRPSQYG